MNRFTIDPDILSAVIDMLQADGATYLNVGRDTVDLGRGPFVTGDPPPAWRELADAVCETCDGSGTLKRLGALKSGSHSMLVSADVDCPDCGGTGKPIHTLIIVCQNDYSAAAGSVDVVVAELVPVELNQFASRDHSHIALTRDSEAHHVNAEGGHRRITPLGPPLQPGDWVVVIRKVER